MPLKSGTHLGPYEILEALGAGGMGEVYRARDSRLDRDVAIKVLPEHLAGNAEALARFERESKAVAALSHPNILAIFDVGAEQGISYAVTELLEGESLRTRLGRAAMGWRKAVETAAALADGLAAAHSKGIIHRDLKPDNIFLTSDGRVKILDFGLARFTAPRPPVGEAAHQLPAVTESGMALGTAGYMSPEQVRGQPAQATSDIFALGCVVYEMVAGRRAFLGRTPGETASAILRDEPPELPASGKQIPLELERVIAHCLEKNPEERFQSARDLAFALRAILGGSGAAAVAAAAGKAIDSVAVLPFVNAGRDPDAEYLSDGITESIINSLAQLPQLRVAPRSTMFRYKGHDADPQVVGQELNVRVVLTGRVVQRGEALVIGAELIDVVEGSQIWGERYSRRLADILEIEEEIARRISEKLRVRLSGEEQRRLAQRSTESTNAYQLYLRGRYHWNKRTEEGLRKALDYFQQAIAEDAGYARAHAGLADCYNIACGYGMMAPAQAMPKAKAAASKALELDDRLAEAHTTMAFARWIYDWDWPGSHEEFRRGFEINPNDAQARGWHALYLTSAGKFEEAAAEGRRAIALDPLSVLPNVYLGMVLFFARRYDASIEQFHRMLEMEPDYPTALSWLGLACLGKGRHEEAVQALQKAARGTIMGRWFLGLAYAVAGDRADALKVLEGEEPYAAALIWTGLEEKEQALAWLEKAYEQRSWWLVWLKVDPRLDPLREDPRFDALLRRMKLT